MERLIHGQLTDLGRYACFSTQEEHDKTLAICNKLAAYEDTGLSPERVAELAKAEKEGLLFIAEAPPNDFITVYLVIDDPVTLKPRIIASRGRYSDAQIRESREIGVAIFKTREEAEAELKEQKGCRRNDGN